MGKEVKEWDDAIGAEGDGIDIFLDEEGGKVGVIAGSLSADADFNFMGVGFFDEDLDELFDSGITFIEEGSKIGGVAVNAEGELGEIVGADRKAIETSGKLIGQEDVRGDFGHHVDLEFVFPSFKAMSSAGLEDKVGFFDGAAKRDHGDDIGKTIGFACFFQRAAL